MSEIDGPEGDVEEEASDPRVADALGRLDDLTDLAPSEHVEVYEQVHRTLQDVLADASGRADAPPSQAADADDPDAGSTDT